MKLKQLLESFWNNNGPTKIFCLAIALIVYTIFQVSLLSKKTFVVPLEIVENGSMTASTSVDRPRFVRVTVRTKKELLATISDKDLSACIDISAQTTEGTATFPVLVRPVERLLLMEPFEVTANPERITLNVEEDTLRFVPISPSVVGTPAHGYEVAEVSSFPSSVQIEGPRSIVESVKSLQTEKVDVSGISEALTLSVPLIQKHTLLSVDVENPVEVKVTLRAESASRTLSGVPVSIINLPPNFQVENGPFSLSLELKGQLLDIEGLSTSWVLVQADCSKVSQEGKFSAPVIINIPGNLSLVSQSLENIDVEISEVIIEENEEEEDEGAKSEDKTE